MLLALMLFRDEEAPPPSGIVPEPIVLSRRPCLKKSNFTPWSGAVPVAEFLDLLATFPDNLEDWRFMQKRAREAMGLTRF